jgi:hypothetical protein
VAESPQPGSAGTGSAAPTASESHSVVAAPAIDVQHLADKVYALLLAEVRLGRARGDVFNPRGAGEGS